MAEATSCDDGVRVFFPICVCPYKVTPTQPLCVCVWELITRNCNFPVCLQLVARQSRHKRIQVQGYADIKMQIKSTCHMDKMHTKANTSYT